MMTWKDIKTSDDRDMYCWQEEHTGLTMADIARDIWKNPAAELGWLKYADDNRRRRCPADNNYQTMHRLLKHPLYKSNEQNLHTI